MELFYFLLAIMPGLYIYSQIRLRENNTRKNEPEYVMLIRGILYSLPLFALIVWYAGYRYQNLDLFPALEKMIFNYKYILAYFVITIVYSYASISSIKLFKDRICPYFSKKTSEKRKKKMYHCGYRGARDEICKKHMSEHGHIVGRLLYDGKTVALGQISLISSSPDKEQGDIGFINRDEYEAYFPDNSKPLLENICNYADLNSHYILEVYNGDKQIRKPNGESLL